jgi:SAM-dependent methyltransferase
MQQTASETIAFLEESGFSLKGSEILDIGCGPGVLVLPLARMGANVTALDISSRSLETVAEIARKENLPVKTMTCSWWSADIDSLGLRKKFDLVIASRTPAINDAESLERMMACSRNLCYYSSFLNVRENTAHREIRRMIFKEEGGSDDARRAFNAYTLFFPFMYLYFRGYRPFVRLNQQGTGNHGNPADDAEQAIRFFSRNRDLDESVKEQIRNYYREMPQEAGTGIMPSGCHGMMTWKADDHP